MEHQPIQDQWTIFTPSENVKNPKDKKLNYNNTIVQKQ